MKQSPSWEANIHSASQKIPPKIHYCVHKNPPLDTVLSEMNAVHNLTICSFKIHFNIILSSTPRPLK
jgi:hypothetical protein